MQYANTELYLLNVPLDKELSHTLYFSNTRTQAETMKSKAVKSFTEYSYQRKDNIIRVNEHIDNLYIANYVMYKNNGYSNKWFYAFITDMKYVNDEHTDIYIETDPLQTWLEGVNYNVGNCFVEREHTSDDTIGNHTIPELLETGEYICNSVEYVDKLVKCVYMVIATENRYTEENKIATNVCGIPVAGTHFYCSNINRLKELVAKYYNEGTFEDISAVYAIPESLIPQVDEREGGTDDYICEYLDTNEVVQFNREVEKQRDLDGYTPRNNKLLCYPYNYLLLSNNSGGSNVYHYELFPTKKCIFSITGIPVIGGSIKCTPASYKIKDIQGSAVGANEIEGIMCGKFPTLSWSGDSYTNWLTQNGVNIGINLASGAIATIGGLATGNIVATGAGVLQIANQLKQVHQQAFAPNSAKGNINGGDINTANKLNTFFFYKMSIKEEYARIIDNYFDMYGYKVGTLKTPNKNHRPHYWFTKTIDANIKGAIPKNDLQKIVEAYNKGITFWKSIDNFRDYSVDNTLSAMSE